MTELTIVDAEQILGQLDGATIASSGVDAEEGLHIFMRDGRCLVITCWGAMAISICAEDDRSLH